MQPPWRPPRWTWPPPEEASLRCTGPRAQQAHAMAAPPVMLGEGQHPDQRSLKRGPWTEARWRRQAFRQWLRRLGFMERSDDAELRHPPAGQWVVAATASFALHEPTARPPDLVPPLSGRKKTPSPAVRHRPGDDGQFPWSAPTVATRSTCAAPPTSPAKARRASGSPFASSTTAQSSSSPGTPGPRTCETKRPSTSGTPLEDAMATSTTACASLGQQASGFMTCRCLPTRLYRR